MRNYTVDFDEDLDELNDDSDPVVENTVVGYEGNYVLIEDDDENQFRLFCEDKESMKEWFPLGSVLDKTSMEKAEPALFERWIGWD